MINQVYRINEKGEPIEPVEIFPDENGNIRIPKDCVDVPLPQPNWKPIFNRQLNVWIETATDEEKGAITPIPVKSETQLLQERVKATEDAILALMDMQMM